MSALGREKQKAHEFKINLRYIARPYLKKEEEEEEEEMKTNRR